MTGSNSIELSPTEAISHLKSELEMSNDDISNAYESKDWPLALYSKCSSTMVRVVILALELSIIPTYSPKTITDTAVWLKDYCATELENLEPTTNRSDRYHKLQTILSVLDGALGVSEVLAGWTARPSPMLLALRAFDLGQADIGLGLAEDGLWDQVAIWQAQKKAGRATGHRFEWRKEVANEISGWIAANPQMRRPELIIKFADWLDTYRASHKGFRGPAFDNLRKTLREMDKQGLITLPPS